MRYKKANLIRSFLLNKINHEIISNFKKKQQMRINGKKEEELYKINCENFEICIIHKLTIGLSVNKLITIKNVSTFNLNMQFSLYELESFDNLKDIKPIYQVKKIFSEKKLKIFPPKSNIKRNNTLFDNQIKKSKIGLLMLRKIVKNLISKTHIIHTIKTAKEENKTMRKNKHVKTVICPKIPLNIENEEYDFKIKLINMSHRGPSHHYKLDAIDSKNNSKKKLTPCSSKLLNKVIKKKIKCNKSKRKSNFMKEKLSLSNVIQLNDSNDIKDNSILTSKAGKTKLTLLDCDSS